MPPTSPSSDGSLNDDGYVLPGQSEHGLFSPTSYASDTYDDIPPRPRRQTPPPTLLAPRPRSWSEARRAAATAEPSESENGLEGGTGDDGVVERLLRHFDALGPAEQAGEEASTTDGSTRSSAYATASTGGGLGGSGDSPQHDVNSSSGRDPGRASASSSTDKDDNDSDLDLIPTRSPSPSPSVAAHEILRTLASMASRPEEIDTGPFSGDVPRGGLRRGGGLSAVEEQTEERTIGSWGAGSDRAGERPFDDGGGALVRRPLSNRSSPSIPALPIPRRPASPVSAADRPPSWTLRLGSHLPPVDGDGGGGRRGALTPPVTSAGADGVEARARAASSAKRDTRDLQASSPLAPGSSVGRSTAASLIALFEGGRTDNDSGPRTVGTPERRSAPLSFQSSSLPSTASLPPISTTALGTGSTSRLADRRSYLSPAAQTTKLPPSPSAGGGRRSVFDLPQFQSKPPPPTSPATDAVPARSSRAGLGLGLFSLRGLTASGEDKGKERATGSETEGSSPLEALTPRPMLEGQLPPLPPSMSPDEDGFDGRQLQSSSSISVARAPGRPRRSSLSKIAASVFGGVHKRHLAEPSAIHARSRTDIDDGSPTVAQPLVRRGAVLVRSLSFARGRGRRRASSAPPVPPSEGGSRLGEEERELRDAVEGGFSWRPDWAVDRTEQALGHEQDELSPPGDDAVDGGLRATTTRTVTRHTLFDTTPTSSIRPSVGHDEDAAASASLRSAADALKDIDLVVPSAFNSLSLGRSPFLSFRNSIISTPASLRSFDPAIERDLERSSTRSTVARTDASDAAWSPGGNDENGRSASGADGGLGERGPPSSSSSSSSPPTGTGSSNEPTSPPLPPSVPSTNTATTTSADEVRSTGTESAGSSALRRLSVDFPSASGTRGVPDARLSPYSSLSTSDVDSQRVDRVGVGTLSDDLGQLLVYLQRQEQWRIGRDALQASQLEHIQQDVLTVREALGRGGPPIPPKDTPPQPPPTSNPSSSSSPSDNTSSSSSTARQPPTPATDPLAPVLELLERVTEAEQTVLRRQDDIAHLLAADSRRRREEREARAAETRGKNVTLHRLDDLLRRVLWLLGDEVFHGEEGAPTEEESIFGPEVRPLPSHPPASIRDLSGDDESFAWGDSSDIFVSRPSWHSSEHGVNVVGNPPPSLDSGTSNSSLRSPQPVAPHLSPPAWSHASLPPHSPPSGHQSLLDERDRHWDEIRRNRSLPHRPASTSSSASTVRPAPSMPAEFDDALAKLSRRARELQERERRLDDDEFRVRENAEAQAQWLADEKDRLVEEQNRMRQAAEDELAEAYQNIGHGAEPGALTPFDGRSLSPERDEPSRSYRHPANERVSNETYRRPLPRPEPIDLPSPVHDQNLRLPPDFDRRTAPSLPYPDQIPYPRQAPLRPAFAGAREPFTQTYIPRSSRSAIDASADYGPYSARSRPGLFGGLFPRRSGRSYAYSPSGFGGGVYPPTPPYGRSSAWRGGYPPSGGGLTRPGSSLSSRQTSSPTTSDDLQRRTTRHVNDVTERVNELQKEVSDLRDGRSATPQARSSTSQMLMPSQAPLGSQSAAATARPLTPAASAAFFEGHPATHSRRSSGSDHQQPVNVTINAPPGQQAPPAPQIPRPSSPQGLMGTLKDIAGPALGGVAGALLGDRHGHKEEEKEHREDRKEERKIAAEERKMAAQERRADEKAARTAATRPPVAPAPAPAVIIPPPGLTASTGDPASAIIPPRGAASTTTSGVPNVVAPGRPTTVVADGSSSGPQPLNVSANVSPGLPTVPSLAPQQSAGQQPIRPLTRTANVPTVQPASVPVGSHEAAPQPTVVTQPAQVEQQQIRPLTRTTSGPTAQSNTLPIGSQQEAPQPTIDTQPAHVGHQPKRSLTDTANVPTAWSSDPPVHSQQLPATSLSGSLSDRPAAAPLGQQAGATTGSTAGAPSLARPVVLPGGRGAQTASTLADTPLISQDADRSGAPVDAAAVGNESGGLGPTSAQSNANRPAPPPSAPKSILRRGPRPPAVLTTPAPLSSKSSGPAADDQSSAGTSAGPRRATVVAPDGTLTASRTPSDTALADDSLPGGTSASPETEAVVRSDGAPSRSTTSMATVPASSKAGQPAVTPVGSKFVGSSALVVPPPGITAQAGGTPWARTSGTDVSGELSVAPAPASSVPLKVGGPAAHRTTSIDGRTPAIPSPAVGGGPVGMAVPPHPAVAPALNARPQGGEAAAVRHESVHGQPIVSLSDGANASGSLAALKRPSVPAGSVAAAPSKPGVAAGSAGAAPFEAGAPSALRYTGADGQPLIPVSDAGASFGAPGKPSVAAGPAPREPDKLSTSASVPTIGADGKPITVADAARPLAPASSGLVMTKLGLPTAAATGKTTDGKTVPPAAVVPGSSGAAPKSLESPAAADTEKLLDEIIKAKTEQQALLKLMTAEMDKQKKEQLALLANLGADLDKTKKEQLALIKTIGADMDKSVKAAQKASTDEIKKTAKEHVSFNVNAHLDQFSKSLAGEVKTLMKEVGDLREAKRALQHEIADLLLIKARHGAGDGMNMFPWQGPKPAAKGTPSAAATKASAPAAASAAPKPAAPAAPTAAAGAVPPPWWMAYYPQTVAPLPAAPAAPAAPPRPPVAAPPAQVAAAQPPATFLPPWALHAQQPPPAA